MPPGRRKRFDVKLRPLPKVRTVLSARRAAASRQLMREGRRPQRTCASRRRPVTQPKYRTAGLIWHPATGESPVHGPVHRSPAFSKTPAGLPD
jgi:hypothetical protein